MASAVAFVGGMFSFCSAAAGPLFSTAASFGVAGAFYSGPTTGKCTFGGTQDDCRTVPKHDDRPPVPTQVAPFVQVLRVEGAIQFILAYGGADLVFARNPRDDSDL